MISKYYRSQVFFFFLIQIHKFIHINFSTNTKNLDSLSYPFLPAQLTAPCTARKTHSYYTGHARDSSHYR